MDLSCFLDYGISFDNQIKLAKKLKLKSFHIRNVNGINFFNINNSNMSEIINKIKKASFNFDFSNSRLFKKDIFEQEKFEDYFSQIKSQIILAKKFGLKKIRVFSFHEKSDSYQVLVFWKKIFEFANRQSIQLFLENESNTCFNSLDEIENYLDAYKDMKIVFDVSNALKQGIDVLSFINSHHKRIDLVHLSYFEDGKHKSIRKFKGLIEALLLYDIDMIIESKVNKNNSKIFLKNAIKEYRYVRRKYFRN